MERLSERKAGEEARVFHYGDLGDMPTYLADAEGETTTSYVQGAGGLAEQREGEATSYPLIDGHGDVTAITEAGGGVESRQSYGPWGEVLEGPDLEMGYLGAWERPTDRTSGLVQMGARAYDPSLGSFLSEDPVLGHVGIGVSANRYPYVWDNPLSRYDLNGESVCGTAGEAPIIGGALEKGCKFATEGNPVQPAGWKTPKKSQSTCPNWSRLRRACFHTANPSVRRRSSPQPHRSFPVRKKAEENSKRKSENSRTSYRPSIPWVHVRSPASPSPSPGLLALSRFPAS